MKWRNWSSPEEKFATRMMCGGKDITHRDYSFSGIMRCDGPLPEICPVGMPSHLFGLVDEETGEFPDFFDDVPEYEDDEIDFIFEFVLPYRDLDYYDHMHIEHDRCMLTECFERFDRAVKFHMEEDEAYHNRVFLTPPLEPDDAFKEFGPIDMRMYDEYPFCDTSYYWDCRTGEKEKITPRGEIPMPLINPYTNKFELRDEVWYQQRAKISELEQEADVIEDIENECILLNVERDRLIAEINVLNPIRDADMIYQLKVRLNKVETLLDGYYYRYEIRPFQLRKPSKFEKIVGSIRSGIFYVGGKIIDGIKGACNWLASPFKKKKGIMKVFNGLDRISVIGGILGFGLKLATVGLGIARIIKMNR